MVERVPMVWLVLAVVTGMLLPLQPAINRELKDHVGSPFLAALVSFTVGTLALVVVLGVLRPGLPGVGELRAAPWWAWVGGLIGAFFVTASIVLVPRLGVVLLVGAVVFGQLISSTIVDHFGLVGMERQRATWGRVVGVVLLLAGVVLIQLSTVRKVQPVDGEVAIETPAAGGADGVRER